MRGQGSKWYQRSTRHGIECASSLGPKRKASPHASTWQVETSNPKQMKNPQYKLASLVCLLALLLSTATCFHVDQTKQSSCGHCPKPAPISRSFPSCCAVQQQPPAITSAEVEHSAQFLSVLMPVLHNQIAPFLSLSDTRVALPPPSPPRIALRI